MAAMASSSSETKQETMYYEELDALTVTTNILSPNGNNNNNQTATKSKKKPHGKKKAQRNRKKMHKQAVNVQVDKFLPPGRGGATITYCKDLNKLYLLGGANRKGESFDMKQISVFNMESKKWGTVSANGTIPDPRSGHSTIAVGTKLYMFGGMARTQDHCLDDLYVLDVSNNNSFIWSKIIGKTKVDTTGKIIHNPPPSARNGHTATFVPGKLNDKQNKIMTNLKATVEENNTVSVGTNGSFIFIFGGGSPTTGPLNDMHILDVTDPDDVHWRPFDNPFVQAATTIGPSSAIPLPREMHSAVFFADATPATTTAARPENDNENSNNSNEDGEQQQETTTVENSISNNLSNITLSDKKTKMPQSGKIYVYGGRGTQSLCADVCVFNVETFEWESEKHGMTTLIPRCGHVSTKVSPIHLAIMGGFDGQKVCNDFLVLNLKKNQWTEAALKPCTPKARFAHTSSFNAKTKSLFVYGGSNAEMECDDLITMNLNIEVKDEGKDGEVNVVDETVKKVR